MSLVGSVDASAPGQDCLVMGAVGREATDYRQAVGFPSNAPAVHVMPGAERKFGSSTSRHREAWQKRAPIRFFHANPDAIHRV